jgi:hypothetical protein
MAQCVGTSKTTGQRCRLSAIPGGSVCARYHGGAAPQVRRKARERLDAMIDPAITVLQAVLNKGIETDDMSTVVRAAFGILDRCGFGVKSQLEVSGPGGGPVELRGQSFRMEDFSIETRRLMLRDMRDAAERRALSGEQDEVLDAEYEQLDSETEEIDT